MVGDIVNLSARLMVAAKEGLLCDHDTYEASFGFNTIQYEEQDPIKVKGKTAPIVTYIPCKIKGRIDSKVFAAKSLIGREDEVKSMTKIYR